MTNKELAKQILDLVGGEANIGHVTHCMTRLRFNLRDEAKANIHAIENLDGVLGAQSQGGQFQVIIGSHVSAVYNELALMINLDNQAADDAAKPKGWFNKLLDTIAAILTPSLPPIIGGGMLKGFIFMFTSLGWVDPANATVVVLSIAADCMFYFFPFLLAVSAARKFRTNEYMALALAGALMYPSIINAATAGGAEPLMFLGFLPIPMVNYSSSVIPIILAVLVLSFVYRFFERVIPPMISVIFTPVLTMVVMVPVSLIALAPLGYYAGEYVAIGIQALINFAPWLAGFVVGATRPFLVLTGMHHALRPITQQQISTYGYSTMGAMNFMSTIAQAAAALGIYLVIRNKKMKQISLSATISGFLGITEPALYGVLVKYKAALWAAVIGGGIGGAVAAMAGARALAPVMPSMLSIPAYMGEGFFGFVIAIIITIVVTVGITVVFGLRIKQTDDQPVVDDPEVLDVVETLEQTAGKLAEVFSPANGELYPMSEVNDRTFAAGIMGQGIAIKPKDGRVVAPFDGTIEAVFPTKHAIGLRSTTGLEVLIHIGIDTVNLNGVHFESQVAQGQEVHRGDVLVEFDKAAIEAAGYDASIIVVATNSQDYLNVLPEEESGLIFEQERLFTAIK